MTNKQKHLNKQKSEFTLKGVIPLTKQQLQNKINAGAALTPAEAYSIATTISNQANKNGGNVSANVSSDGSKVTITGNNTGTTTYNTGDSTSYNFNGVNYSTEKNTQSMNQGGINNNSSQSQNSSYSTPSVGYINGYNQNTTKTPNSQGNNYVVISCFEGGGEENMGTTFDDAAKTKLEEILNSDFFNPEKDTVKLHKIDSIKDFKNLLKNGDIYSLDMFGHGGPDFLVIGSGDGPNKREYLNKNNLKELYPKAFVENGKITLYQCKTAYENGLSFFQQLHDEKTIAEQMSGYFGVSVTGFTAGSTAVPTLNSEIDYSFKPISGEPVYFKTNGDIKTYEP